MSTALQPLSQSYRDENLDALRGFALAGVLFVFCAGDIGYSSDHVNSTLDEAVKWFKYVMIEERMYGMLILIFGLRPSSDLTMVLNTMPTSCCM